MEHISTVRDLIDLWPKRAALADDLTVELGEEVRVARVHKWAKFGCIPSRYLRAVLAAGQKRGLGFDALKLIELHGQRMSGSERDDHHGDRDAA